MRKKCRKNLIKAKERSKQYYDKKIHVQEFKPGEFVFLLNGAESTQFSNHYRGPYKILEVPSQKNIKIKIKNKSKVVSADRLRHSYVTYNE